MRVILNVFTTVVFVYLFSLQVNAATPEGAEGSSVSTNENNEEKPFPFLERQQLGGAVIAFSPKDVVMIMKRTDQLDANHPLYCEDGMCDQTVVMKTAISPALKMEYLVVYSPGPSADPTFIFYDASDVGHGKALFTIGCTTLYIPENGNIYTTGHTNNMFNMRRKFRVNLREFTEEIQPFYYVGLTTKTLRAMKLYDKPEGGNVIAQIPTDYAIEVLVAEFSEGSFIRNYLIKTQFGLTGWVRLRENQIYGNADIEGLFYAGD
ncbi:MAG: hypothetical protein R6U85_01150 [Salinivirgaceae bacterium]